MLMLMFLAASVLVGAAQSQRRLPPEPAEDDSFGLRAIVTGAGYSIDPKSLASAMYDNDPKVAIVATRFITDFPPTADALSALRHLTQHPNETLAVTAFRSLLVLGQTGWEDDAVRRLDELRGIERIELAGVLARSGRSLGWQFIKNALEEHPELRGAAIDSAVYFDGLIDDAGAVIDSDAELRLMSSKPGSAESIAVRSRVDAGLKSIATTRAQKTVGKN
jgi:hypothetical protein